MADLQLGVSWGCGLPVCLTQRATLGHSGLCQATGLQASLQEEGLPGWGAPGYLSATPAPLRSPWLQKHPPSCSLKTGTSRAQGTEAGVQRGESCSRFPRTVPDPASCSAPAGCVCLVLTLTAGWPLRVWSPNSGVRGQQLLRGLTQEALGKHPPSQTPPRPVGQGPRGHSTVGGCWVLGGELSYFLIPCPPP